MAFRIKLTVFIVLVGIFVTGSTMAKTDYKRLKNIADKIVSKIPSTWRVIEEKTGVIPYGHYDGLRYEGPGGLLLVLEGDRDVFLHWKDETGVWHKMLLAKESLEIWIMPPKYHQSWKRFFVMKSPVPAERIYSGKEIKVYGYPAHHIVSLKKALETVDALPTVATAWPDSPYNTGVLSWTTWKKDINAVLQDDGK